MIRRVQREDELRKNVRLLHNGVLHQWLEISCRFPRQLVATLLGMLGVSAIHKNATPRMSGSWFESRLVLCFENV
jgi:hypothetical protein